MRYLILILTLLSSAFASTDCRCRPNESCWPSTPEWNKLNSSIQGNLVAVRPAAAVCHGSEFNKAACEEVTALWNNSSWRAAHPGVLQWQNWEAWPERNQSCYIEDPQSTPCGQGRISLYSALVKSASHIQETVRFAKKHNIRLVIKNSGHDFLGRSSSPQSLQILTNGMKDIEFTDDFVPRGAPKSGQEGQAVTLAAGVNLKELYDAVSAKKLTVIAGTSHTVGAAGGYIAGGGHSALGTWKGMASDNALEFQVVTADGSLIHANAYQNSDLFWALRGGGGGTFGVVVSVTIRTFSEVPVVMSNVNISTSSNDPSFWKALTEFHAHLPSLNDAGGGGYYFISPNYPLSANTTVSTMSLMLSFPNTTDTNRIDELYDPLLKKLNETSGVVLEYESVVFPGTTALLKSFLPGDADTTGERVLLASRLFSRDLLESEGGPAKLISALSSIELGPYERLTGHVVAGGAVARNGKTIDSALNPAWREAIVHITVGRGWSANATLAEQEAIRNNLTNVNVPIFRSVEGTDKMGAYLNEADAYETDFQASFWGANYRRLYQIKQKWDPTGLFITRRGVGSEDWDDTGFCLVQQPKV